MVVDPTTLGMHAGEYVNLWLHLLGVVVWVGGLFCQLLVVVPGLQRLTPITQCLRLTLSLEARFRMVMWPAVGVVLFTGLVNVMKVFSGTMLVGERLPPEFVQVLSVKLILVLGMLVLQAVQQFVVQPRRIAWLGRLDAALGELPGGFARLQRLAFALSLTTFGLGVVAMFIALFLRGL
jgi:copper resistance protein D